MLEKEKRELSINGDLITGLNILGDASGLMAVSTQDPKIQVGAGITTIALSLIKTFITERNSQRITELNAKVGLEFISEICKTDTEVRDLVLQIIGQSIEESSIKKRDLYYQYLKKLTPTYDSKINHTKLLVVISMIEFWQIDLLFIINRHYYEAQDEAVKRDELEKLRNTRVKQILEKPVIIRNKLTKSKHTQNRGLFTNEILMIKEMRENFDEQTLSEGLQALTSLGLIKENQGLMNGTSYGPITQFGKSFIEYISED